MTVYIGSDHGGIALKKAIIDQLTAQGVTVCNVGTDTEASCDYPDYAFKVAGAVASGKAERGIVICRTGVGMSIAANKVNGVRCALCLNEEMARLCREHNDANCLALGAANTDTDTALKIAQTFLTTDFAGGRHANRVEKITAYEGSHER
ncbi:MAG: ribose 5-phosphate isomerase B [Clostridiales bacterium]|nr:ribose 5-phosphate isomerase B [Clostridiales bacterium]